jgi:Protein of unknown function (DUF2637)
MNGMGRHSPPVEGIVANGHAPSLVPFAIPQLQVRQGGPMAPWPQPAKPDRWCHVTSATRAMLAHRGWLAAIPVILVNAVAFYGQLAFLRGHGHLPAPFAVQALVAVALESIAVYLAWQAHLAQLADDSALRLRLAAYGMAALIGAMNYSHYAAPHWRPTFAAIAFALCSAISPWLWSIHSRRESRDTLKARGLIEPHAVRLGVTRWLWHPWRSPRVMWQATWAGENDPAKAIALTEPAVPSAGQDDSAELATEDAKIPPAPSADDDEIDASTDDKISPSPAPPSSPRQRQGKPTALAKALAIIKRHPGLTDAEVAERAGVSPRTVQRAREANVRTLERKTS